MSCEIKSQVQSGPWIKSYDLETVLTDALCDDIDTRISPDAMHEWIVTRDEGHSYVIWVRSSDHNFYRFEYWCDDFAHFSRIASFIAMRTCSFNEWDAVSKVCKIVGNR